MTAAHDVIDIGPTRVVGGHHPGSLLKELDLSKAQFLAFLDMAARLKRAKRDGCEARELAGRNFALIFEKASARTRCAFEVAADDQGTHVTYLGPDGSHIGKKESIADTARVLGQMYDGIAFRGFAQSSVAELADRAGVPVWNGLTNEWHPTSKRSLGVASVEGTREPLLNRRIWFT
jgi:ornithine carbamoyltransferase